MTAVCVCVCACAHKNAILFVTQYQGPNRKQMSWHKKW